MTHTLLFCIAEEAIPFVWEVMNAKTEYDKPGDPGPFYLVESNVLPADRSGFRNRLREDETFETDFIGASLEDCQAWALEKQYQVNFIEQDLIVVVDARSAQDKTVLVSHYVPPSNRSPLVFPGFGALPRECDTWYNYRVEFSYASIFDIVFYYAPIHAVYPAYFGRKEDFTDERGVFNVAEAKRFSMEYNMDDYYIDSPRL